jgi:hypothetical protein
MRGNGARVVLPAAGVLALVGVVAVAATGSTSGGSGGARSPSDVFLDTMFSLVLLAIVPAAALLVYGLMQRKAIAEEMAARNYRRTRLASLVVFSLLFFGIAAYVRISGRDWGFLGSGNPDEAPLIGGRPPAGNLSGEGPERVYEPEFAWLPVLVLLTLVAVGLAAWRVAVRRERASRTSATVAESLADAIDETLDDLLAETDPRRAVIAAYARLERVLGAYGLPRLSSETQEEYLARILGDLEVDTRSIRRLTDLFTQAKFSLHEVDDAMKAEAVAALVSVRNELRAAENRRAENVSMLHAGEGRA